MQDYKVDMDKKDLQDQLDLDYSDHLLYLKKKYGMCSGSYYLTEACVSTNAKIRRGSEGLQVHHDKEWNPDDISCHSLSSKELALKYSFDYQKPENLTYCNALEHFLLHIKIYKLRKQALDGFLFIDGIESYIIPFLNDIYRAHHFNKSYLKATKESIQDNYDDYLKLIDMYSEVAERDPAELLGLSQW